MRSGVVARTSIAMEDMCERALRAWRHPSVSLPHTALAVDHATLTTTTTTTTTSSKGETWFDFGLLVGVKGAPKVLGWMALWDPSYRIPYLVCSSAAGTPQENENTTGSVFLRERRRRGLVVEKGGARETQGQGSNGDTDTGGAGGEDGGDKWDFRVLSVQALVLAVLTYAMGGVIGNSVVLNAIQLCGSKGEFFRRSGAWRLGMLSAAFPSWVDENGGTAALLRLVEREAEEAKRVGAASGALEEAAAALLALLADEGVRRGAAGAKEAAAAMAALEGLLEGIPALPESVSALKEKLVALLHDT
ncbi:hypothetical protein HKI87_09g56420 [Chloropicon roscoffensis]|uniref:Uncharacterized protein n=2 Tax=Chloropicon roscoffensis TaxID=1461544 RepID=A0AAX4PCW6_9CHLO